MGPSEHIPPLWLCVPPNHHAWTPTFIPGPASPLREPFLSQTSLKMPPLSGPPTEPLPFQESETSPPSLRALSWLSMGDLPPRSLAGPPLTPGVAPTPPLPWGDTKQGISPPIPPPLPPKLSLEHVSLLVDLLSHYNLSIVKSWEFSVPFTASLPVPQSVWDMDAQYLPLTIYRQVVILYLARTEIPARGDNECLTPPEQCTDKLWAPV